MFFSDKFKVSKKLIDDYGAVDISLVCDIPLFIDPMLIFSSSKKKYQKLHDEIINYFIFLQNKASKGLSKGDIKSYFTFKEVVNNWLGFSKNGNKGNGFGTKFANFLSGNLKFVNTNNNITKSTHIEKVLLLYDGSGKDKISDMTTRLILEFLCEYTQEFAKKHIKPQYIKEFSIDCGFNYVTEAPNNKSFVLPFIINEKGKDEYVLLTPKDILRADEPAICKKNFLKSYSQISDSIDNEVLRVRINNYISVKLAQYLAECKELDRNPSEHELDARKKEWFYDAASENPELYDYFIKYIEGCGEKVAEMSNKELEEQLEKFFIQSKIFIETYKKKYREYNGIPNSREELKSRIMYYKHCIEDCDCYKCFYSKDGLRISNEDDLQRFFRLVWYGTSFDVNYEANNGRGELDVKVSFGAKDKTIAELKLASNPHLKSICEQTEVYEKATICTEDSIYVIFFFTEDEQKNVNKLINESKNKDKILKNVILIDCRSDNKPSGSQIREVA